MSEKEIDVRFSMAIDGERKIHNKKDKGKVLTEEEALKEIGE